MKNGTDSKVLSWKCPQCDRSNHRQMLSCRCGARRGPAVGEQIIHGPGGSFDNGGLRVQFDYVMDRVHSELNHKLRFSTGVALPLVLATE